MRIIAYRKGYKYQLNEPYIVLLPELLARVDVDTQYISWDGYTLVIKKGYAWDGPSGPTIDTRDFMRGSLVHDALYQLMREGYLGSDCRKSADKILKRMCLEDGMLYPLAQVVYVAVRLFARFAADPASKKPLIRAP